MKFRMLKKAFNASLFFGLVALSVACTKPALQRHESGKPSVPALSGMREDRRILAGEWEYEDGAVVKLRLDERGNGTYAWKDGHFETIALNDHTWEGLWFQKENDREGGFVVEFSPDYSEGEGRWWYIRIGTDQAPTQNGGTFHLSKRSSFVSTAGKATPIP